jgi:uncharacterized membrane protein
MPESLVIIFAVVLLILTIVMSAVGIYLIITLIEVRGTLRRVNNLVDDTLETVYKVTASTGNLGGWMSGLAMGMQVFKAFMGKLDDAKKLDSDSKTK